jgi:hypothetical protein
VTSLTVSARVQCELGSSKAFEPMELPMIKLDFGVLRLAKYVVPIAALALGIAFAIGKWAPETAKASNGRAGLSAGPARLALIIANADYPEANTPLRHPVTDAQALADALRRIGFAVEMKANLGAEQMKRAFEGFKSRIKPGSVALVYFGGVGIQVGRQSYMIPVDAKIWKDEDVRRAGISIDSVLSEMHKSGAGVKLAIVDASRRNPFERRFRGFSAGLTAIDAPPGTLLLSAAAPGKLVDDREDVPSLMMAELLKEMEAPGVSAEAVFNRTRMGVSRASNGDQVPLVSSSLTESFVFAMTPSRPDRLASLADKPPVLSVARAEPGALHVLDPSEKASEPVPAMTASEPLATITASEPIAVVDASPPVPAIVEKKFTLAAESDARPQLARPAQDSAPAKEPKAGKSLDEVKLPRRPVAEITAAREEPRPTNRRPYASSPSGRNWRLAQAGYVFGGPVIGIGY